MIKAVIFDVDGLMIDTEKLHSEAHAVVIKKYGKEPEESEAGIVHIVGKSILENSEIIRRKYNINQTAQILEEEKGEAYLELLKSKKIEQRVGLKNLIKLLKKNKIKMAIGSSGIRKGILLILHNLQEEDSFPVIISGQDVKQQKPNPDIYLEAAKKLGEKSQHCLVLEDSQSGVEAAKNAGMKVIAIPNKYTEHQDFFKANLILNSLEDINWTTILNI